jgi:hypothetical protein
MPRADHPACTSAAQAKAMLQHILGGESGGLRHTQ